ncbi:hypothetical protein QWJ34_12610 [Saccharibacillus sp. CPCC 101409]|uniref:hypothetical protein n=1 Tax=Saccharibacillus sp. CPCC 101409 TaxID=3058041 RepID=UPI0026726352|nr:hypothetical protein [Saccharibacillus sp. CPCC 101409]MDO3410605.1 hypothetical protein [Saccharibacillus sp. CPCC 101409]
MFLKKNCTCQSCLRTFECTGTFDADGARYIAGPVALMQLLSKEPDKLLLEGRVMCTGCATTHHFLVEYDCEQDRYIEIDTAAGRVVQPSRSETRRESRVVYSRLAY